MAQPSRRSRKLLSFTAGLLAVAAGVGFVAWYALFRTVPVHFADETENFKYGTIGVEQSAGIPYWIWVVLPRVFPEYLPGPGGYASLGMLWEEGEELPIGFSKTTVGFPRVGPNCSFCHTSSYRTRAGGRRHLVPGGASTLVDTQGYVRFLASAAADPRFTAENLLPEIEYLVRLSFPERLLYRHVLIPQTRRGLAEMAQDFAWMDGQPEWGAGRIDPFNPVKVGILGQSDGGTIGAAKMMALWALREREGQDLHWDGLNSSIREVVLSSAIGDGTSRRHLDLAVMQRVEDYLLDLPAPAWPFPVDAALAENGRQVFEATCASCHGTPGAWTGRMLPVAAPGEDEGPDRIGTDAHRIAMWDQPSADAYNRYGAGYDWKFESFRNQEAYSAIRLTGIWLRAPYLHNGSVPTLWHMLNPEMRPDRFYRGNDLYDAERVGFVWDRAAEGARRYFLHDVRQPGNSNQGHRYGSDLPEADKLALLEYLKTL